MKPRIKIVRLLFELAGLLALFLTGWVACKLYEIKPVADEDLGRRAELRDAFFRISASLQTQFNQLEEARKSVDRSKPEMALERFQGKSQEWEQWLAAERRLATETIPGTVDANRPGDRQGTTGTNQPGLYRGELIAFLKSVAEAGTNYLADARYLIVNARQPWLGRRLAEREQQVRDRGSKLLGYAEEARARGNAIESELSAQALESRAVEGRILRLTLFLLVAVVSLCFLFLLRRYRRKQAEQTAAVRRHAEQLAKLDKLAYFSSQLAQEHAHEIKQPLTAMNAHLHMLQKTLPAGSTAHKDAAVIRSEITRLNQIVEKLLQRARPANAVPVPLTADQVLGEVRDLMASQLEQAAIEFRYDVEGELGFRADPQQLKQVLINLVKNAAESIPPREIQPPVASGGPAECMPEGEHQGVITLRAKKGTRQFNGHTEPVTTLEVEDTGGGIPVEIQEKIFDPFFSTKAKGSGLGLAISARIIEQHGGRLEFDTHVGHGTIFRIVLPAAAKEKIA